MVYKFTKRNSNIIYRYIICPECNKLGYMNIKDNIITINCLNNHKSILSINEFINKIKIEENKIKCDDCGNNKILYNKFYFCSCNMNICPLCITTHIKGHNIIDYHNKYNVCVDHNDIFVSYCSNCNKNLCQRCEKIHSGHKIILYKEIKPNKNKIEEIKAIINELKLKMNKNYKKLQNIKYWIEQTLINYEKKYKDFLEL